MVIKEELKIEKTIREESKYDADIEEIISSSIELIKEYSNRADPEFLRSIDVLNLSSAVSTTLKSIELSSNILKVSAKKNQDTIENINKLFSSTKEVLNNEEELESKEDD
jgi:hypothetical protein